MTWLVIMTLGLAFWAAFLWQMSRTPAPKNPSASEIAALGASMSAAMLAAIAGPTAYERHRDNWIRTGDVAELEQMAEHVTGE
jgi:glucose dehydrogenase